jgi:hypothetical protein
MGDRESVVGIVTNFEVERGLQRRTEANGIDMMAAGVGDVPVVGGVLCGGRGR